MCCQLYICTLFQWLYSFQPTDTSLKIKEEPIETNGEEPMTNLSNALNEISGHNNQHHKNLCSLKNIFSSEEDSDSSEKVSSQKLVKKRKNLNKSKPSNKKAKLESSFNCDICQERFGNKVKFYIHYRSKHPEETKVENDFYFECEASKF